MTDTPTDDGLAHTTDVISMPSLLHTPSPHPEAAEIIRQVEYYFSEENLPYDKHLLGLFKEGNGTVSFNEITGFKKMRHFKPKAAVREALRQSTLVQVSADGKRLSRKIPLETPIAVTPQIDRPEPRLIVPEDKPWLTKGMLKPTGFEEYHTDAPIHPQEYEEDRQRYDPDFSFESRIEMAVMRYCARRKMYQYTRHVFTRFLLFGGMEVGVPHFLGGLDGEEREELTKREIAERTSQFDVSSRVLDGLAQDDWDKEPTYVVDFERVAKAFLSSHIIESFVWFDVNQYSFVTNILRNFYNYLILHDVCPEYHDQIMGARKACDVAEVELPKLRNVGSRLSNGFNMACSVLYGGRWEGLHAKEDEWEQADSSYGMAKEDADLIFKAAVFAHGTDDQLSTFEGAMKDGPSFSVVSTKDVALEIISLEPPGQEAQGVYASSTFRNTIIRPMGKMKCKIWNPAHAPAVDLSRSQAEFGFLIDEEVLQSCLVGMKMECQVKELDLGFQWIDRVEATYPSFYVWLANEEVRTYKKPKSPKGWTKAEDMDQTPAAEDGVEEAKAGADTEVDESVGEIKEGDQDELN